MASDTEVLSHRMLIGEKPCEARSGEYIQTHNPATGEAIARFPRGRAEDIDDAVRAAHKAFPAWRATSAVERAALVTQLADRIIDSAEELALIDVRDNGSPIREMRRDTSAAAASLRYFAGLALELKGVTIPSEPGRLNFTLLEPFGVVGKIIPFNHPFMFAAAKCAAPLVAGNTVIVKPSEHTSLSALRLAELAAEVLPPGVLNVVTGYGTEAGDALVTHPGVRRLGFTGSAEIGRSIQQRAATEVVKTVTLELGGKNPILIFPDADLADAVDGAVRGMNFTWQGQSCGSTSRLFVHDAIRDEFVERLVDRIRALRPGTPQDEATDTGAIVHRRQYEKVLRYLSLGREEGARVLTGGGPPDDPALSGGMFIQPTVFDRVEPDSRLAQEEIFGPVLAVMRFGEYDEGIRLANSVHYGLTASVYTRDLELAHRFAEDVEAGFVWVNDTSRHFPGAPYGGVKDSGVGREESLEELESYSQVKNVNIRFRCNDAPSGS